jgi:hypothetical protein
MYCYLMSEPPGGPAGEMWSVGYYADEGEWTAVSDWATADEAARHAAELNAGREDEMAMRPRPGHPVPEMLLPSMP